MKKTIRTALLLASMCFLCAAPAQAKGYGADPNGLWTWFHGLFACALDRGCAIDPNGRP
jgi:hypothetical protein